MVDSRELEGHDPALPAEFAVMDASLRVIATSPDAAYAELIAWALNQLPGAHGTACAIHPGPGLRDP